MYFPIFCFSAAVGLLLARAPGFAGTGSLQTESGEVAAPRDDNPLPGLLAGGVIVVLMLMTVVRTVVWLDDAWLWREAISRAPGKARPKVRLSEFVRAGEALELLSQAREIAPHDPEIPARIGKIRLKELQPDAALDELSRAVALDPKNAENFNNRGVAFAMLGATEPARADFQHALELDPALNEARTNLQKLPPAQ
jgi:tetratricopeptide (TPR) repeat protein